MQIIQEITVNGVTYWGATVEHLKSVGATDADIEAATRAPIVAAARRAAEAKIEVVYPLYRQLNILRSGKKADSDKMGAFIDAVRAWSNSPAPDAAALEAIQP
jgi:hypothetical protein